jgi:hypothetical protein
MDQETQDIIKERFQILPDDVKKAVSDADLPAKIENIAKKNGLLIDQSGGLLTEVYLVMLGMDKSENFSSNVAKNLGISLNLATAIAGDVNREIFLPIRESLMDLSEMNAEIEKIAEGKREDIGKPITDPAHEISSDAAMNDFISNKISTPNISSTETATIKPPISNTEKKYSSDPYREPIN